MSRVAKKNSGKLPDQKSEGGGREPVIGVLGGDRVGMAGWTSA